MQSHVEYEKKIGKYTKLYKTTSNTITDEGVTNKTIKYGDDLQKINKMFFWHFLGSCHAATSSVVGEISDVWWSCDVTSVIFGLGLSKMETTFL